jgi:hypothetical protein
MKLCINGLNIDNSRLRECSYCFFAVLARVFEVFYLTFNNGRKNFLHF